MDKERADHYAEVINELGFVIKRLKEVQSSLGPQEVEENVSNAKMMEDLQNKRMELLQRLKPWIGSTRNIDWFRSAIRPLSGKDLPAYGNIKLGEV